MSTGGPSGAEPRAAPGEAGQSADEALERQLHQQIIENPDDLALRQVYADLLCARDDERGLFIRLQCDLATLPRGPRRDALEAGEREVLKRRWAEWAGHARAAPGQLKFMRGFVEEWTCTAADFLAVGETVTRAVPLRRLSIYPAYRANELLAHPAMARVPELELHRMEANAARAFHDVTLPRLRRLELVGWRSETEPLGEPFEWTAQLPALETLELRVPHLPADYLLAFAGSMPKLKRLVLAAGHMLGAADVARLQARFGERLKAESF